MTIEEKAKSMGYNYSVDVLANGKPIQQPLHTKTIADIAMVARLYPNNQIAWKKL